jgi:hypothetical protein
MEKHLTTRWFPLTAVATLLLALLPGALPARAATLTVTHTMDSGYGSLRWAIEQADGSAGPDTIEFAIPMTDPSCDAGTGVCTFQPASWFWLDNHGEITVDGYTQPDAQPATGSSPATIKIQIDGAHFAGECFHIGTDENAIQGLAVYNCDSGFHIYNAQNNTIAGNHIGTDASGSVGLGSLYGVSIRSGPGTTAGNTIGGNIPAERNVISGNGDFGVRISGWNATGNVVSGNYIGTDIHGRAALSNGWYGVYFTENANGNIVGGDSAGERNVISGNGARGVAFDDAFGNTICGNLIGTDATGTGALGNSGSGVHLGGGSTENTIGPNNVIAYNTGDGVTLFGSSTISNTITQNSIYANDGMGIDLRDGANGGILAPVISSVAPGSVRVEGTACPGCTVELFQNGDDDREGEAYLGSAVANNVGTFSILVPALSRPFLTATAMDEAGNTSEFAEPFETRWRAVFLPVILRGD